MFLHLLFFEPRLDHRLWHHHGLSCSYQKCCHKRMMNWFGSEMESTASKEPWMEKMIEFHVSWEMEKRPTVKKKMPIRQEHSDLNYLDESDYRLMSIYWCQRETAMMSVPGRIAKTGCNDAGCKNQQHHRQSIRSRRQDMIQWGASDRMKRSSCVYWWQCLNI